VERVTTSGGDSDAKTQNKEFNKAVASYRSDLARLQAKKIDAEKAGKPMTNQAWNESLQEIYIKYENVTDAKGRPFFSSTPRVAAAPATAAPVAMGQSSTGFSYVNGKLMPNKK
jgi:hypothetical protein